MNGNLRSAEDAINLARILFALLLSLSGGCHAGRTDSKTDEVLRHKELCERFSKVGLGWVREHYFFASHLQLTADSVFYSPSRATCVARVTGWSSEKNSHVWFVDVLEHKELTEFVELETTFLEMQKKADAYETTLRK